MRIMKKIKISLIILIVLVSFTGLFSVLNFNQKTVAKKEMSAKLDCRTNPSLDACQLNENGETVYDIIKSTDYADGIYNMKLANDEIIMFEIYTFDEDITYTTTPTLCDSVTDTKMCIVRYKKNLTIEAGVTMTSQVRKKGFLIMVDGDLTNNGTISMTARGANIEGQDVLLYKTETGYELVPAIGAAVTAGGRQGAVVGAITAAPAGRAGTGRQTGGGGTGAGRAANGGGGAAGTSYSGGPGGGGGYNGANGIAGAANGGRGGNGQGSAQYTWGCGGGAGNPGGSGISSGNPGGTGTGGLLIIYARNIDNRSVIQSNGANGGTAYRSGAGGSGGGSINIFYNVNYTNTGSVVANGGARGNCTRAGSECGHGGAGGAGTVTSMQIGDTDARLATLNLSKGTLIPSFNSDIYDYEASYASEDYKININATTVEPTTTITSGTGEHLIPAGTSLHTVNTLSEGYTTGTYTIRFNRNPSPYQYIDGITVDGNPIPNFNPNTYVYYYDLAFDDDVVLIDVMKGRPSQTVSGIGEIETTFGVSSHVIYVISEDGTRTQSYTIIFNRENTTKLKSVDINGYNYNPDFNPELYFYEMTVPSNTMALNVDAIPFDSTSTVSVTGNGYIKGNSAVITITVTNPNAPTTTYVVDVTKEGSIGEVVYNFTCTGDYQTFTAPVSTNYKFELWGAAGGPGRRHWSLVYSVGKGAYSTGTVFLNAGETVYVYVGCVGGTSGVATRYTGGAGGYNGGGTGGHDGNRDSAPEPGGGGGGATDIRLLSGPWNNFDSLKSRLMVAAGGGGTNYSGHGGAGGTLNGIRGVNNSINSTQISGYGFGYGMSGGGTCSDGSGGAGSGYYGGYTSTGCLLGGGGGSSFVSGCIDCDAIDEDSTSDAIIHTGQPNHYSGIVFEEIEMINGNSTMPNTTSGYITGKTGHGHAKITALPLPSENNYLASIYINKGTLVPDFDMEIEEYDVTLGVDDTKLSVRAVAEDDKAIVSGNGTYDIPAGTTTIEITVTAESGAVRIYRINVTRPASSESKPFDIIITGLVPSLCAINDAYCNLNPEFDENTNMYYMTVPSRIKDVELTAIKKHDYQVVIGEGIVNLEGGVNVITIEITSEDGSNRSTYVFNIDRDMTGNTDLDVLTVDDPERDINFNPDITEYFIAVPNEYTSIGLTATPSDPRVTPVIAGNEDFVVGLNTISIYMQAVNGEEKTYLINVYRELSGNTFLSNLEVINNSTSYPLTPVFNKIINTYTTTVPNEVDTIEIVGNPEVTTTVVTGLGSKNLITGTNKFEINTRAEDGSTSKYTITIIREKSNNADLSHLNLDGLTYTPLFDKDILEYNVTVDPGVKNLVIDTSTVSDKARYSITGNSSFKPGMNVVTITVTAENGNKKIYKINVNRLVSDNNYLLTLNTDHYDLTNIFNKNITDYSFTVPYTVTSINVTATKEDPLAILSGTGRYNLKTGINSIEVTVKSESGLIRIYTLNVTKEPDSNANLSDIRNNMGGTLTPSFDKDILSYTINVPNEITSINITGILESNAAIVIGNGTKNLNVGDNYVNLIVTAENGTVKTYTINIIRDLSSDANLSYLLVKEGALNPAFKENILSYDVKVAYEVTELTIDARVKHPNSTYQIIGNENLIVGDNEVIIRVTSESGYTKDYLLNVTRQEFRIPSNRLLSLSVNRGTLVPSFDPDILYYEVELDYVYSNITVSGTKEHEDATVDGFGTHNLLVGPNIIPIKVTASDGIERDYQIVVTRKVSNNARLSTLAVKSSLLSPTFLPNIFTYTLTTYDEKLDLTIIPEDTNATYVVVGNDNLVIGNNNIDIIVTAPDGVTRETYRLNVIRELSNNNNLSFLEVLGTTITPSFNKTTTLYTANVANDVNSVIINAIKEDVDATLSYTDEVILTVGENIAEITVTSASGNVKIYTVIINRAKNSDNKLKSLEVDNEVISPNFDSNINNYTLTVPYETERINITALPNSDTSTVSGNIMHELNVGSNSINVVVTAEDGSTNTYTIVITRNHIVSSKLKNIDVFPYYLDNQFDSDLLNYVITIDNELTSLPLSVTTLDPNATYVITGNNNFVVGMNTIEIEVTASNGIDKTIYTLEVMRQSMSNTYLAYIYPNKGTLIPNFDKTNLAYTVMVDSDINTINIDAETEVASSTVIGTGNYNLNYGDNKVILVVTSNTGIKRTYTVTVVRAKDDDHKLASLTVKKGSTEYPLNPIFDPDTNIYNVDVPVGTENVELSGTANPLATITGLGTKSLSPGMNSINVVVTSHSGISNTYTININRPASNNNNLTDIIPNSGNLNPSFNYFLDNYTLVLDSSVSLLYFDVSLEDKDAKVTGHERMVVPDGTSNRIIAVTAEDGTIKNYTITVIKDRTDEARLSNLAITNYPFNETFDPNLFIYTVTVPSTKNSLLPTEVVATSIDNNAIITKDSVILLSSNNVNVYKVNVRAADGFTTLTYEIHITRERGSDSTLANLEFAYGNLNPSFNSATTDYVLKVPDNVSVILGSDVTATPTDSNATVVKTPSLVLDDFDDKYYTISVTSNDGASTTIYRIKVESMLSSNTRLSSLTSDVGSLLPSFNPNTRIYTLNVFEDTTSININALVEDDKSTIISGTGNIVLNDITTNHEIVIEAEDGTIGKYIITINKSLTRDLDLANLEFTDYDSSYCLFGNCILLPIFDPAVTNYSISFPNEIETVSIVATKKNEFQTIKYYKVSDSSEINPTNYNLVVGNNYLKIEVTNSEGDTKNYFVNINRQKSANNYLSSLTITNPDTQIVFDKNTLEYFVEIDNDFDAVTINATAEDSNATVYVSNSRDLLEGNNDILIRVTAPNGDTRDYIVHILRKSSYNNYLRTITVSSGIIYPLSPKFNKTVYDYTVTVPNGISSITLEAVADDITTTILGEGIKELVVGNNRFTLIATAASGEVIQYTVNIIREKATNVFLRSLSVSEGVLNEIFDRNNTIYTMNVDGEITNATINALPEDTNATVTIRGNTNLKTGKNVFTIIVMSSDKTTSKTYMLTITRDKSINNQLLNLTVDGNPIPNFDPNITFYDMEVPTEKTSVLVEAIAQNANAYIFGTGDYALMYGYNNVEVTVIAENGDAKVYRIRILRKYSNNLIDITTTESSLDPTFDKYQQNYTIEVENDIEEIIITGILEDPNATLTGNGLYYLTPGNNLVKLTVTGVDGIDKIYSINVIRKKSNNNNLSLLEIKEGVLTPLFDSNITDYTTYISNEYNEGTFTVIPEHPDATYEILGNSNLTMGDNEVIIRVTAPNGDIKDYIINVVRQDSSLFSNRLLDLKVNKGTLTPSFRPDIESYAVTVDEDVTDITITVIRESVDSRVTGMGTFQLQLGRNRFPVVVTSKDGVTRTYEVIVNRKKSSDARLQFLEFAEGTLSPVFNQNGYEYLIIVESDVIKLNPTIIKPVSSGTTYQFIGNSNFVMGVNYVTIKTTSADLVNTLEYNITVLKEASHNNNLLNLTTSEGDLSPTFDKDYTGPYEISVSKDVNNIVLSGNLESNKAFVTGLGSHTLKNGDNYIPVTVTSESGSSKTYIVIVKKEIVPPLLLYLDVSEGSLDPPFNPNTNNYQVEVENDISEIEVYATKIDPSHTLVGNRTWNLVVGENIITVMVIDDMGVTNTYTITVTRKELVSSKLIDLTSTEGVLSPLFAKDILSYSVNVPNEITTINLFPVLEDPNASYVISGNTNLVVGNNTVTITVTDSLGIEQTTYTINVNRQISSNNFLRFLATNKGTLDPVFDKYTNVYEVVVPNNVTTIEILGSPEDINATVMGLGEYTGLQTGKNTIPITVTSATGATRTYFVNIIREKSDQNKLLYLNVIDGTLNPTFDPDINDYTIFITKDTYEVTLEGYASFGAVITGLGAVTIVNDETNVSVTVTSESGISNVYNFRIIKQIDNDVSIEDIIPSSGTLTPAFDPTIDFYEVEVEDNVSLIDFDVITTSNKVTITGDKNNLLNYGVNVITIEVIAEDNITKKQVIINVNRKMALTDILLSDMNIVLMPGGNKEIGVTYIPAAADDKELTWVSNDPSIATVDANGKISGIALGSTTVTVTSVSNPSITKIIGVEVLSLEITTLEYDIKRVTVDDEVLDYVTTIESKTNIKDFINNFDNPSELLRVYDKDDNEITDDEAYVGTLMKLKLVINNVVYDEITIVVNGDLNGDGEVDISDLSIINFHILKKDILVGYKFIAGDTAVDEEVDISDIFKVNQYIIKKLSSLIE